MRKIFGVLTTLFFLYQSAEGADKILLAYPDPAAHFVTFPLAAKQGLFKDEGLDVGILRMGTRVATLAISSEQLGYFPSIGASVQAAVAGIPTRIVASYVPAMFALVSRPEFKSVQELKGKTIGVSVIGATPHIIARMIVKHFGLDPTKDVQFVNTGGPEGRLAKQYQGMTAATVVPVPVNLLAKSMGFNILARSYDIFSYPEGGLIVNAKTIKERPDEIKRVIKAGIRANRYIRANREGTIQFLIEWQKIDREIATGAYASLVEVVNEDGSLPERGLRLVIDEAKKAVQRTRELPLSDVEDLSILREAQRELGITAR
jgi:ABC-type nitrate/sulfonate/bicarbonate transport system substrate-binding protein